jgi:DNA ligase (NAD+)
MTIKELRSTLIHHNRCYYDLDAPEISDYDYDQLIKRLRDIDPDADDFIERNLGQSIFGEKFKHDVKMGSLAKSHTAEEIDNKLKYPLVATHKIDGISLALHYSHGHLVRAVTRGDGIEGEVVTENVKQLTNIPLHVDLFEEMGLLQDIDQIEVRGEGYVDKKFFFDNRDRIAQESGRTETFANPRNYASGSIRQKDPAVTKKRSVSFVAYKVVIEEFLFDFYHGSLDLLKKCQFEVPHHIVCNNRADVDAAIEYFRNDRPNIHYDTDGVVFVMDNHEEFDKMGWVGKTPKGALAFKYDTEKKETKILDIEWNTGRTGKVVPVAILTPTEIAGSTVSRMTLNSCDFIEKNDVAVGDTILFEKANEIIPQLVEVLNRPADRHFNYPTCCPSCRANLVRESAYLVCREEFCPSQIVSRIEHFLKQLGVKGISDKTLSKILESGLATTLREIFLLDQFDLEKIGFGERQAEIFINALSGIKVSPEKFLGSLGIEGASERSFTEILGMFAFDDIVKGNISAKELAKMDGYAMTSAETIVNSLKKSQDIILAALEFVKVEQRVMSSDVFRGKTFCITGTLTRRRKDVEEMIKNNGGTLKSVGKGLDYLVVGNDAGSKLDKAQSLGIPILSEGDLFEMIE